MFDGHPNVQRLGAITVGEDAEEMLRLALDGEKGAVAQFNAAAQECHALGDHGTAAVFEEMVRDEEKHADWFESQLDAIERVGAPAVPRPADRRRRGPLACRALAPGRHQRLDRRDHLGHLLEHALLRRRSAC